MVRQCHENTCPVGIATQREDLRAKFTGTADQVVQLFRLVSEEIRRHLASLGVRSLDQLIGRADMLTPIDPTHPLASQLSSILVRAEGRRRHPGYIKTERSELAERLARELAEPIAAATPVRVSYPITNVDRTIGSTVSGLVAQHYGDTGLPDGTIRIELSGTAGQSFGAWLAAGVEIRLDGTSNDYVGKGMGGGRIIVVPTLASDEVPHGAGNAVLYGATGGQLFVAGRVGQRFAVRNSGAVAVVEGASDHACEYMTGGTAVILGEVGRNFGAGMTGGTAYVYDEGQELNTRLSSSAPAQRRPSEMEQLELKGLLEEFARHTGSPRAAVILADWEKSLRRFWVFSPNRREAAGKKIEVTAERS
jgi:glutamate synthase domain-containing protein 3